MTNDYATPPSDAELIQFATDEQFLLFCDEDEFVDIARAVLQRYSAALQSQDRADAERFRWLTEDHADAETRTRCREILDRMAVLSYSAACDAIDHARRIEGNHD